jgi:hypothetical protein
MADQFPEATKMVLSPAAQAVLDAFLKDADEDATLRLFQGHLADALRAAADQVVPSRRNYQEASDILATTCLNGMLFVANELRLMADELKADL